MNRLSEFLSQHIGLELWVATLIAIALVTVLVNQLAQVLLRHAAKVTEKTNTVWDDALVRTASRPVRRLVVRRLYHATGQAAWGLIHWC